MADSIRSLALGVVARASHTQEGHRTFPLHPLTFVRLIYTGTECPRKAVGQNVPFAHRGIKTIRMADPHQALTTVEGRAWDRMHEESGR